MCKVLDHSPCSCVILTRKRRCRPGLLPPTPGINDSVLLLRPGDGRGGQSSWSLFGCAFGGVLMLGEEWEGLGLTQSLEIEAQKTRTTICLATGDS